MKWWDQMPWSYFSECWALSHHFHSPLWLSSRGYLVPSSLSAIRVVLWRFLKKTGNRTAIWPSNPTTGHTHQGNQNLKRHMYPNIHRSTVYNSQGMEATWCPSADEWIRKLWYICTMEYYSAIKKNTSESALMRWIKLEPIIQSEVSQKEKHQYTTVTHIYGI